MESFPFAVGIGPAASMEMLETVTDGYTYGGVAFQVCRLGDVVMWWGDGYGGVGAALVAWIGRSRICLTPFLHSPTTRCVGSRSPLPPTAAPSPQVQPRLRILDAGGNLRTGDSSSVVQVSFTTNPR